MKAVLLVSVLLPGLHAAIVADVRAALNEGDFKKAEHLISAHKANHGVTPEWLEAHSWLGRGALARKQWDDAERYADETRRHALAMLKGRNLDDERHLPIALGASIEVQGHAAAGRGERSAGVSFLKDELQRWRATSIRTRIQKNLHLLSLEGTAPPPLETQEWLGPKPPSFSDLKGKPAVLFFWAHWCGDCKAQLPVLARLKQEYEARGLRILGPTQPYGYIARGTEAPREEEIRYIDEVRKGFFGALNLPAPVSEENFKVYGVSTTPTLVLLDREGVVRMYHPGKIPYEELAPKVAELVR